MSVKYDARYALLLNKNYLTQCVYRIRPRSLSRSLALSLCFLSVLQGVRVAGEPASDFYIWRAPDGATFKGGAIKSIPSTFPGECVLGRVVEHVRRKPQRRCRVEIDLTTYSRTANCPCKVHDIECDDGRAPGPRRTISSSSANTCEYSVVSICCFVSGMLLSNNYYFAFVAFGPLN